MFRVICSVRLLAGQRPLPAVVTGNKGTDFHLVIVAQCLVAGFRVNRPGFDSGQKFDSGQNFFGLCKSTLK